MCTSCRDYPNLARKDHLDNVEERKDTVVQKLRRSVNSWVMFYRHPAFFAVIALASTYMTVLSLDNGKALTTESKAICFQLINVPPVTYGYALLQCIRESVLGVLSALAALVGIVGSIAFPFLRKRLNVTRCCNIFMILSGKLLIKIMWSTFRTGVVGFASLVVTYIPTVISIFLPGSPFELAPGVLGIEEHSQWNN